MVKITPPDNYLSLGFKHLKLNDWKQFQSINFLFHPRVTIITGANGSGKTTILNLLSKHFGWELRELATPAKIDAASGGFKFFKRLRKNKKTEEILGDSVGIIQYTDGTSSPINIPSDNTNHPLPMPGMNAAQYSLIIANRKDVKGLYIPSHRSLLFYQNITSIPTQKRTNEQAYQLSYQRSVSRFNEHPSGGQSGVFVIKETLLSWAIAGEGNSRIEADSEMEKNFTDYENILKLVLPKSLGFTGISIRNFEVVLTTITGDFMIDGASGGISSIIDLSWQIFNYQRANPDGCVVVIDEIENHLHPSMQRSILPDFISAFPNTQFIVSTHSPLIIGSEEKSHVYALRYSDDNQVTSELLDFKNKAQNAVGILREILDVPVTIPIWVEHEVRKIINEHLSGDPSPESAQRAFQALKESGLNEALGDLSL